LTLDFEDTHFRKDKQQFLGVTFDRQDSERLLSLTWSYDSTNEPFLPTRGTIVRIAPVRTMRDRASFSFERPFQIPVPEAYAQHINGNGVDFAASRYWELSDRVSLSAGLLAGWDEVDDRMHPQLRPSDIVWRPAYEVFRAGYSRSLRHDHDRPENGDSRIELDARFVARQHNVREGADAFGSLPDHENSFQTSVNWARRSSWGMLRVGVGYAWGH
jgi:hypothetical protein